VAGPALSTADARGLVLRWYHKRDPARFANSDQALHTLETGDAYEVDRGLTQQIACGCRPHTHLHKVTRVRVLVPRAPVRAFVAQIDTETLEEGIPGSYTVVFVADSGIWHASIVALNEPDARAFHAAPGGPKLLGGRAIARRLLAALGAYAYRARTTGHVPFSTGEHWAGYATTLAATAATHGQDRPNAHGIYEHYTVPVPESGFMFPVAEGRLVCGGLTETIVYTPGLKHVLSQDEARRNWGSTLAPGNYFGLVQTFDNEVCVIVHKNGIRDVIAYYGTETDLQPRDRSTATDTRWLSGLSRSTGGSTGPPTV
jgi:hypothetical protein